MTGAWKSVPGVTCKDLNVTDYSRMVDTRESCSYCRRWLIVDAWDGTPEGRVKAGKAAGWDVWTGRLYGMSMMPQFTCPECHAMQSTPAWRPMTMARRHELQEVSNGAGVAMIRAGLRAHESRFCQPQLGKHGVCCTCPDGGVA